MAEIDTAQPETISVDPSAHTGIYEVESLCMSCHENGSTRLLPIQIPYFKQILLESFSCEHCGDRNNSVKNAGPIQEKGSKYTFKLESSEDFQRQVVRGDTGNFRLEDVDLAMPMSTGQLTNLESMFNKIRLDLESDQPARREQSPDLYTALARLIDRLDEMIKGKRFPITVSLDDISGNSFIAPSPADVGTKYVREEYLRSHEQNVSLGLAVDDEESSVGQLNGISSAFPELDIMPDDEIYEIPAECPACTKACTVNIKKVNIPHFKEVIVMATVCDHCGYRTNDVKTGGAIPEKGKRITLKVVQKEDLSRDILKSESCCLKSPQLSMEVQPGTLGGRFTTVEGLLVQVRDQLYGQIFDVDASAPTNGEVMKGGDSMATDLKTKWLGFFDTLDKALKAEIEFEIVLEDPLASSHIQLLSDHDQQVTSEAYERTEEEIEELGLNDMRLEGYEEDEQQEAAEANG